MAGRANRPSSGPTRRRMSSHEPPPVDPYMMDPCDTRDYAIEEVKRRPKTPYSPVRELLNWSKFFLADLIGAALNPVFWALFAIAAILGTVASTVPKGGPDDRPP